MVAPVSSNGPDVAAEAFKNAQEQLGPKEVSCEAAKKLFDAMRFADSSFDCAREGRGELHVDGSDDVGTLIRKNLEAGEPLPCQDVAERIEELKGKAVAARAALAEHYRAHEKDVAKVGQGESTLRQDKIELERVSREAGVTQARAFEKSVEKLEAAQKQLPNEKYWKTCEEISGKEKCSFEDVRSILKKGNLSPEGDCRNASGAGASSAHNSGGEEPAAGMSDRLSNAYQSVQDWCGSLDKYDTLEVLTSVVLHNGIQAYARRKGVAEHNKTSVYWGSLLGSALVVALGRAALDGKCSLKDAVVRFAWNAGANAATDAALFMGKYACSCLSGNK